MRSLKILTMLLILGALACGLYTIPLGQGTDTATSSATTTNNAVFIAVTDNLGDADTITATDIENGCHPITGSAPFNVDATSGYNLTVQVTSATVPGATPSGSYTTKDPFHLNSSAMNCTTTHGKNGVSPGLTQADFPADGTLTAGVVTSGTDGYDATIYAAIYFKSGGTANVDDAYFTDAPHGTYSFTITATVTD